MSIRSRIIFSFSLLVAVGFYFLVDYILKDLRPRYLEAVEETLVDQAHILAAGVEAESKDGKISTDRLKKTFQKVKERSFSARIYRLLKTRVDERVYVTDDQGIVLFDSDQGKEEGRDFSNWRDIFFTLRGEYGARATRLEPSDPTSSILHVSAPIRWQEKIIGALTVAKPTSNLNFFIETARPQILIAGALAAISAILLGIGFSLWVTRPLKRLTDYARAVRDGRPVKLPDLGQSEIKEMGGAFEEMREALEGKKYVENYVQSLAHELKSPLAAVRGAAELMDEEMPQNERHRFLQNIRSESGRMEKIVERMLKLASLEARRESGPREALDLKVLAQEASDRMRSLLERKDLKIQIDLPEGLKMEGERFLIEEAFLNLLQNAVDFSPRGGRIHLSGEKRDGNIRIFVDDEGPGIPDYALPRVFEKFYSLNRPDTGLKSTGLGLSFVKEIAHLHGGQVKLENLSVGARAQLMLPIS